ncbi:hypothetical protein F5887DRAFT_924746 [Amanita rubescens]|nr:hypothetical protein F5887DRAFT_924746 [Amanita rubescens]
MLTSFSRCRSLCHSLCRSLFCSLCHSLAHVEVDPGQDDLASDSDGFVSIPVPAAPKKPKIKKTCQKNFKVVVVEDDFSDEDESSLTEPDESSVTEPDSPWEDAGVDTEAEEVLPADSNKAGDVFGHQSAAERRFANEQPVWSDDDKKQGGKPGVAKNFVLHGKVVEISDGETNSNESPTLQLVPSKPRVNKKESISITMGDGVAVKKEPLQSSNLLNVISQTDCVGGSTSAPLSRWPSYTDLVKSAKSKELSLSAQSYELRLVIRKAMHIIEGRVRFHNSFPDIGERSKWNRSCLQKAAQNVRQWSQGDVKIRYSKFYERFASDDEYVNEMSTLLDPRISILRGNVKTAAVLNARTSYDLHAGSAEKVKDLLYRKQYIYPLGPNGQGYLSDKPFENKAIIGTLRDDLFEGSNNVIKQFPGRFRRNPDNSYTLTPSMIALAATAVFAVLKEWETGPRIPAHFTSNVFTDIYRGHMNDLENIQNTSEYKYRSLLRRLFRLASSSYVINNTTIDNEALIDIENMADD